MGKVRLGVARMEVVLGVDRWGEHDVTPVLGVREITMAKVRVDGVAEVRAAVGRVADALAGGARGGLAEAADALADDVRARVAVDTGNLASGVEVLTGPDGLTADVGWDDPDEDYAQYPEAGTSRQPAQPALGPAAQDARRRLPAAVTRHVRRRLGR